MTTTVNGKVGAPEGLELEVIEAYAGVEQSRYRAASGSNVSLCVFGSNTLILREVTAGLELKPVEHRGEQRHGTLDVPNTTKPGLEDGGLEDGDLETDDPVMEELDNDVQGCAFNLLGVVDRLVKSNAEPIQMHVYEELLIAHGEYKKALALADAHEAAQYREGSGAA